MATATGLTHLRSAEGRDKMHKAAAAGQATDSIKMFLEWLEGRKPASGVAGQQPEWFYKSDGSILVALGAPLIGPDFALDGDEQPEGGLYDCNRRHPRAPKLCARQLVVRSCDRAAQLSVAPSP